MKSISKYLTAVLLVSVSLVSCVPPGGDSGASGGTQETNETETNNTAVRYFEIDFILN